MALRQLINERPIVGVTVAAIIIAVAIVWVSQARSTNSGKFAQAWYYDLGSAQLFPHAMTNPPIDAPSGKTGVLAMVFACNNCSDESDRFIAWLETYTPQAAAKLAESVPPGEMRSPADKKIIDDGKLIATRPDAGEPQWVPSDSPAGEEIRSTLRNKCREFPTACTPR